MQRKRNRLGILSFLMCMVMVLSSAATVPVSVMAEENSDEETKEEEIAEEEILPEDLSEEEHAEEELLDDEISEEEPSEEEIAEEETSPEDFSEEGNAEEVSDDELSEESLEEGIAEQEIFDGEEEPTDEESTDEEEAVEEASHSVVTEEASEVEESLEEGTEESFEESEVSTWDLATVETKIETDGDIELTSEGGELTGGSYILYGDVTLEEDITIPEDNEVTIDLNGFTLTGTGDGSVITVYGELELDDSEANQVEPISADDLPSRVYSSSGFSAETISFQEDSATRYTTYYSVTDYDDNEDLAVSYYSYTSGAVAGGSSENGGGIFVDGGVLTLKDGTITGNQDTDKSGGGVHIENDGSFSMSGGAVSGNTAYEGAGVDVNGSGSSFTMSGGVISGNVASNDGGGVHIDQSEFTMSGGVIANNEAQDSYGGGVLVGKVDDELTQSKAGDGGSMTVDGGTITNNTAGGGTTSQNHYGGGIGINAGTVSLSSALISGNTSTSAGGGIYAYRSEVTMENSTIAGNTTENYGGGIDLKESSRFTMKCGLIKDNKATESYIGAGGGIYMESNGELTVTGGSVEGNEATYGGGIYLYVSTADLTGGTVQENEATYGGGVYAYNQTSVTGGTIQDNKADYGGGLYGFYDTVQLSQCEIIDNTASNGGGIYISGSTTELILKESMISGNQAEANENDSDSGVGGGIYVASGELDASAKSDSFVVANNTADQGAADVYEDTSSTVDLSGIDNLSTIYEADQREILIDAWYADAPDDRYEDAEFPTEVEFDFNDAEEDSSQVWQDDEGNSYYIAAHAPYILIYDPNCDDASGSMDKEGHYNKETVTVLASDFMRSGYSFVSWNTKADGSGESYVGGDTFIMPAEDVTLYAQWEKTEKSIEEGEKETEEESSGSSSSYGEVGSGSLAIMKVDSETGEYLEGATFALYNGEGKYINSYTTNEDGWLSTNALTYGTYCFIEVEAPEGYLLDSDPVYVSLTKELSYSADYPWTVKVENTKEGTAAVVEDESDDTDVDSNDDTDDDTNNDISDDTVSVGGREVPATGDDSNLILWIIFLVASGAGIGLVFRHKNAF